MLERRMWWNGFCLVICLLSLLFGPASAQTYPTRPVRLVVTVTPGGPPDRAARLLAHYLDEAIKQPVVVENRTGAGSLLGADYVAKALPDGYTLLISSQASISLGPLLRSRRAYDPVKDFAHVALIGTFPMYFMVRGDNPAKSFREFLAMAKAKPGIITYGTSGIGSLGNLLGELIKKNAGVNIMHVAYKGVTPAITDLLGGHIQATYIADSSAMEFARSGKMRMLATTTEKRVPTVPDVPAMDEIVPGVHGSLWYGVSAPAQTPQGVIDRLQKEILSAMRSSEVRAGLTGIGMTPVPLGADDFLEFIRKEMRKWEPIVKANNIKID